MLRPDVILCGWLIYARLVIFDSRYTLSATIYYRESLSGLCLVMLFTFFEIKQLFYFCKSVYMVQKMVVYAFIWYIIWLNWLCHCSEIWGPRKHKFCWFGCLEERFDCTVCLLSLRPALTVYVWLYVSVVFMLVLCWFGRRNKNLLLLYAACCGLLFALVRRWVPATTTTPLHHIWRCEQDSNLPLHSTTSGLYPLFFLYFFKIWYWQIDGMVHDTSVS